MASLMYVALALGGTAVSLDPRPPVKEYVDLTGDGIQDILLRDKQTREPELCLVRTPEGGLKFARVEPADYWGFVCATSEGFYNPSSGRFFHTPSSVPNNTFRNGIELHNHEMYIPWNIQ